MAGAYKGDQSSSGFGASSSSKSDVAPSAPPLETRSEYESLLGKDRERPDLHQDEHKHIRWVLRQTFVGTPAPLRLFCYRTQPAKLLHRCVHDGYLSFSRGKCT